MWEIPFPVWLLNISNFSVMICANLLVQSTLIIMTGLCIAYAFKSKGAAVQSLILRSFLIAVFMCPLVSFLLDAHGISGLKLHISPVSINRTETFNSSAQVVESSSVPGGGRSQYKTDSQNDFEQMTNKASLNNSNYKKTHFSSQGTYDISGLRALIYIIFAFIWIISSLFFLCKLTFYYIRIIYVRKTAFDAEPVTLKESKAIARQLKIDNPIILKSSLIKSPFLTGLSKPVILLPKGIKTTREILLHELAHLVRRDCLWNLLSYLGIALLPLQPLMRVLCRQIEDTSDYVCDDYVVKHSYNSLSYARQLFNLTEHFQPLRSEMATGVGIVSYKSSLRQRVERILEDSRQIFVTTKKSVVIYVLLICFGATVLTGFIGFKEKNGTEKAHNPANHSVENVPVKLTDDTIVDVTTMKRKVALNKMEIRPEIVQSDTADEPLRESQIKISKSNTENTVTEVEKKIGKIETEPVKTVTNSTDNLPADAVSTQDSTTLSMEVTSYTRKEDTKDVLNKTTQNIPDKPVKTVISTKSFVSIKPDYYSTHSASTNDYLSKLKDADACKKTGTKLLESGKYAEAEQVFLKAWEFEPKDPEVQNLLGKAYFGKREYTLAILFFKKAINLKHNYADAYYNMGDVYFENGDLEGSMQHYKTAIRLNPSLAKIKRPIYLGSAVRRVYY